MDDTEDGKPGGKSNKRRLRIWGHPEDAAALTPEQLREERKVSEAIKGRLIIARKSEECEITDFPISELPEELWYLKDVYLLWANNNKLTILSPLIGNLVRLQVIKLNNNMIKMLPNELGLCVSLIRLWLHNNLLESLPRTIGCLCNLVHLSLEKNNLMELPLEFGRLTSITAMSYDEDKIPGTEVDILGAIHGLTGTERWKSIQSCLRRMDFAHIYKRFEFPVAATVLPFARFPHFLSVLVDLRQVVLSGHQLVDLPYSVISCFSPPGSE